MIYPTKKFHSKFKATPKIPTSLGTAKEFYQKKFGLCYFIASHEKQAIMHENAKRIE